MSRSEFTANLQMAEMPAQRTVHNPLAPTAAELARAAQRRNMATGSGNFIARLLAFGKRK